MKAVQILGDKGSHKITLSSSLPKPQPKGGEVLVRVYAAGITADEVGWPELYQTPSRIPGHDISGIIEQVGPDYGGPLSVDDSVYAMLHADRGEGQAEYAIALPDELARKPKSLSHAEAAALPIPVLTAWEALFRHANAQKGSKILVTGASGAVGMVIVQLAKQLLDADVVALASSQKSAYVQQLGASQVIDYKDPSWETSVTDVDVVIDTVGGSVLAKTWRTAKSDGIIVTVGDPVPAWAFGGPPPEELKSYPNVRYVFFILSPDSSAMAEIAGLIDAGRLKTVPVVEFPIEKAVEAWEFGAQRNRSGKAVIQFGPDASTSA